MLSETGEDGYARVAQLLDRLQADAALIDHARQRIVHRLKRLLTVNARTGGSSADVVENVNRVLALDTGERELLRCLDVGGIVDRGRARYFPQPDECFLDELRVAVETFEHAGASVDVQRCLPAPGHDCADATEH